MKLRSQPFYAQTIPPKSVVRLVKVDRFVPAWSKKLGQRYRVGYYNRTHGLDDVWLVDETGVYGETATQEQIRRYFLIERLSKEGDYYGRTGRRLGPLQALPLRVRTKGERMNVKLPRRWSSKIIGQFKWPIKPLVRKMVQTVQGMKLSRASHAPLHYFVWPDKMRSKLFKGRLPGLMRFIDCEVSKECSRLRRKIMERLIEDWEILIIRSLRNPDLVWVAVHQVYFVPSKEPDIWPNFAIQRTSETDYVVWGS